MTHVIKRGGKEQKFISDKIKRAIDKAAKEAKLPPAERKKLVREVAGVVIRACRRRKTIRTTEIGRLVASKLQKKSKVTAAAWRKYAKRHKRKRSTKKKRSKKRRTTKKRRKVVHHKRKRRR